MDSKVTYGLIKRFTVSIFLCRGREVESEEIIWFGFGAGKDNIT